MNETITTVSIPAIGQPAASAEPDGDRIINLLADRADRATWGIDRAVFAKALAEVRRLREKKRRLQSKNARLENAAAPVAQEPGISADLDDRLAQALEERDTAEGWADGLAAQIGKYFGQDIGEHSNLNNPWQGAKEIIEDAEPYAPAAQEP